MDNLHFWRRLLGKNDTVSHMKMTPDDDSVVDRTEQNEQERYAAERQQRYEEMLSKILEALQSGEPLHIGKKKNSPLGDTIVFTHAWRTCLREFAQRNGVQNPIIHLSITRGVPLADFAFTFSHSKHDPQSSLEHVFTEISTALNVPLSENYLHSAPILYQLEGYPALENVDYQRILELADKEEEQLKGKKVITICQAGSIACKKFSDEQLDQLESYFHTQFSTHKIRVLRDSEIRDINALAALFYVSEKVITTDTAWSWIAGSIQMLQAANQRDPSQVVVFHPLTNDFWHVPGTESIYGPATALADSSDERNPGLLLSTEYQNYADGRRLNWRNPMGEFSNDIPITDNDFEYFMEEMEKVIEE